MAAPVHIAFYDASIDFDGHFQLSQVDWQLGGSQHWLIAGPNGAGKSALAAALGGVGELTGGTIRGLPTRVGVVSYEAQAELIAAELKKDDADILDVISEGTAVGELIERDTTDTVLANTLIEQFGLKPLLNRAFRKLSTGETRKVMLVRALASEPELLVLDEPFDGLDAHTHAMLQQHLASVVTSTPTVLVLNRIDEKPEFTTHIAWVSDGKLAHTVDCNDGAAMAELQQLLHLTHADIALPDPDPAN